MPSFGPSSAVLDVSSSIRCLQLQVEQLGGIILLNQSLKSVNYTKDFFTLKTTDSYIKSDILVNCAEVGRSRNQRRAWSLRYKKLFRKR